MKISYYSRAIHLRFRRNLQTWHDFNHYGVWFKSWGLRKSLGYQYNRCDLIRSLISFSQVELPVLPKVTVFLNSATFWSNLKYICYVAVMISHENLRCTIQQFFIIEAENAKDAKGVSNFFLSYQKRRACSVYQPLSYKLGRNQACWRVWHLYHSTIPMVCMSPVFGTCAVYILYHFWPPRFTFLVNRSIPWFKVSFIILPRWNVDAALELIPKYVFIYMIQISPHHL